AHRSGHPHAESLAVWARGIAAYLAGDWANAARLCERAAELLRERCTGVAWELITAQRFLLGSLQFLGEVGELVRRVALLLAAYARTDDQDRDAPSALALCAGNGRERRHAAGCDSGNRRKTCAPDRTRADGLGAPARRTLARGRCGSRRRP